MHSTLARATRLVKSAAAMHAKRDCFYSLLFYSLLTPMYCPNTQHDNTTIGASFPARLYQAAINAYLLQFSHVDLTYESTGSTTGKTKVIDNKIDFGGSDSLFTSAQFAESKNADLQMYPTVASAIVVVYNLPEPTDAVNASRYLRPSQFRCAQNPLILDRAAVSLIFYGVVTKWNDQYIKDLNPNRALPDETIRVIVRSGKSGTTNVFTNALNKFRYDAGNNDILTTNKHILCTTPANYCNGSMRPHMTTEARRKQADFLSKNLPGDTVTWPTDVNDAKYITGKDRSDEQLPALKITPYSISYASADDAFTFGICLASLKNRAGSIVRVDQIDRDRIVPDTRSIIASMIDDEVVFDSTGTVEEQNTYGSLIDARPSNAWPISSYTYLILRSNTTRAGQGCTTRRGIVDFWAWFYNSNFVREVAVQYSFATLPFDKFTPLLTRLSESVRCNDGEMNRAVISSNTRFVATHVNFWVSPAFVDAFETFVVYSGLLPTSDGISGKTQLEEPKAHFERDILNVQFALDEKYFEGTMITRDRALAAESEESRFTVPILLFSVDVLHTIQDPANPGQLLPFKVDMDILAGLIEGTIAYLDDKEIVDRNENFASIFKDVPLVKKRISLARPLNLTAQHDEAYEAVLGSLNSYFSRKDRKNPISGTERTQKIQPEDAKPDDAGLTSLAGEKKKGPLHWLYDDAQTRFALMQTQKNVIGLQVSVETTPSAAEAALFYFEPIGVGKTTFEEKPETNVEPVRATIGCTVGAPEAKTGLTSYKTFNADALTKENCYPLTYVYVAALRSTPLPAGAEIASFDYATNCVDPIFVYHFLVYFIESTPALIRDGTINRLLPMDELINIIGETQCYGRTISSILAVPEENNDELVVMIIIGVMVVVIIIALLILYAWRVRAKAHANQNATAWKEVKIDEVYQQQLWKEELLAIGFMFVESLDICFDVWLCTEYLREENLDLYHIIFYMLTAFTMVVSFYIFTMYYNLYVLVHKERRGLISSSSMGGGGSRGGVDHSFTVNGAELTETDPKTRYRATHRQLNLYKASTLLLALEDIPFMILNSMRLRELVESCEVGAADPLLISLIISCILIGSKSYQIQLLYATKIKLEVLGMTIAEGEHHESRGGKRSDWTSRRELVSLMDSDCDIAQAKSALIRLNTFKCAHASRISEAIDSDVGKKDGERAADEEKESMLAARSATVPTPRHGEHEDIDAPPTPQQGVTTTTRPTGAAATPLPTPTMSAMKSVHSKRKSSPGHAVSFTFEPETPASGRGQAPQHPIQRQVTVFAPAADDRRRRNDDVDADDTDVSVDVRASPGGRNANERRRGKDRFYRRDSDTSSIEDVRVLVDADRRCGGGGGGGGGGGRRGSGDDGRRRRGRDDDEQHRRHRRPSDASDGRQQRRRERDAHGGESWRGDRRLLPLHVDVDAYESKANEYSGGGEYDERRRGDEQQRRMDDAYSNARGGNGIRRRGGGDRAEFEHRGGNQYRYRLTADTTRALQDDDDPLGFMEDCSIM
jgi:ABC-type phosphate transport system substrate-binding protein